MKVAKTSAVLLFAIFLSLFPQMDARAAVRQPAYTPATAAQKRADLHLLYDTLAAKHKDLFCKTPQSVFERQRDILLEKIPSMSDAQYYLALREFVALAGDAQTTIELSVEPETLMHPLAFEIQKFEGSWRLIRTGREHSALLGMRVTAINEFDIEEVLQRCGVLVSYENNARLQNCFPQIIRFLEVLKALGVAGETETGVALTLRDSSGHSYYAKYRGLTQSEYQKQRFSGIPAPIPSTQDTGENYNFFELDGSLLFIQYNTGQEDPKRPMDEFARDVSQSLVNGDFTKVVVDLRYNSQGDPRLFAPLLETLTRLRAKKGYILYTFIGGQTFSSGIINAMNLRKTAGSMLVGTPTGGSVNAFGDAQTFPLQYFPARVSYSTRYYELDSRYQRDSLYPDISVAQTFENYQNGVDSELQAILSQ